MATLGLARKTVKLVPHNKLWAKLFLVEKKELGQILGSDALAIEHVGSTSVPGLAAKPVIDVAIGLQSFKNNRALIRKMSALGYFYRPNWGRVDQHILFAKGNEEKRTHYLHFVKYKGASWKRYILFRNYLISHPSWAKKYESLKLKLAKANPTDRPKYTEAKSAFIKSILARI